MLINTMLVFAMLQDITRATGLGFSVSQLPLMVLILFYYPDPQAVTFSVEVRNLTDSKDNIIHFEKTGLSVAFLITSAAIAVFASMTTQLHDNHMIDNMMEYNQETFEQLFIWNATQYFILTAVRIHFIAILCSPLDIYCLWLLVLVQSLAMIQLVTPKSSHDGKLDSLCSMLFIGVVFLVLSLMPSKHGLRLVFWTMLAVADLLFIVGHTYDTQKNTECVANCRVFYNCVISSLQILLYIS
jgi:hypothetical protein